MTAPKFRWRRRILSSNDILERKGERAGLNTPTWRLFPDESVSKTPMALATPVQSTVIQQENNNGKRKISTNTG
jgi:hypothetical protein